MHKITLPKVTASPEVGCFAAKELLAVNLSLSGLFLGKGAVVEPKAFAPPLRQQKSQIIKL